MEAMTKHRSHSAAFKRQVAEEFIAGETLHSLSKRHDVSRQLIRIWVGKFEAGALDEDVQAADLIQEYEAKIAAASQKPSEPSPVASSGAIVRPRAFKSTSSSRQLWALSRMPTWKPSSSFLPSGVVPISTSMHSACGSMRACR